MMTGGLLSEVIIRRLREQYTHPVAPRLRYGRLLACTTTLAWRPVRWGEDPPRVQRKSMNL
jgi:hypothetical protein